MRKSKGAMNVVLTPSRNLTRVKCSSKIWKCT